jgi:iron complex outermembrane receptor protein
VHACLVSASLEGRTCPRGFIVACAVLGLLLACASRVAAQQSDAGAPVQPSDAGVSAPAAPTEPELPPSQVAPEPAPAPDAGVPIPEPDAGAPAPLEPTAPSGEIIVTAQRYEQDVQKTPVAVDAFSLRSMDERGVSNLQDVGKFTPNLQLQATNRPAGGGSAYAAYIRGIGTGDFQFPTDPGVGLYVDDVYIARTIGGLMSTDADLERIEVIKGPQGTLFGRNTIGGAINILTSKPHLTGDPEGTALVRLGTYGRKDFTLSANTPLVENVVGAKLTISSLHSDGYGERVLDGQKTNGEERLVARGGLMFRLSEDLKIRLDGDYSHQDQAPPTGVMLAFVPAGPTVMKIDKYNMIAAPALNPGLALPTGSVFDARWNSPGDFKTNALQPMYDRYNLGGGAARIMWSPSDAFSLKSITAARALSSDVAVDGDQTPYPLQSSHTKLNDQQYSEELQVSGYVAERLNYTVGLFAFRESGRSTIDTQSFHGLFENEPMQVPADAGDTFTRFQLTATSLAAFTQETFRIIDSFHITAGARINRDQKDYDYGVDFTQRGMAQIPATHASASWVSFTPKAGLDWSPIEPVLLYASYSQGFKSGGFSASNNPNNPAPVYNPERVTGYELGVKTHWFEGRKLTTDITGFYNDYRDIQLTVQSVDPMTNANVRSTQNSGGSKIKGFEAEVVAAPVRGLNINAGLGYVDAKFDSLSSAAQMSGFKLGDPLPQIPNLTFNAGLQYAFDIGVGELSLRYDVSYKGKTRLTVADPTSEQAGYALHSARIAFVPARLQELELAIYGVNLADERYYVYLATLPPTGQKAGIPGAPRLIFGMVKYTF